MICYVNKINQNEKKQQRDVLKLRSTYTVVVTNHIKNDHVFKTIYFHERILKIACENILLTLCFVH